MSESALEWKKNLMKKKITTSEIALKEKNTSKNTPWNGERGWMGEFKNNNEDNEEDKEKRANKFRGRKNTYLQMRSFYQMWIKGSIN